MSAEFPDRNELARMHADILDTLADLREQYAESQKRWAIEQTRLELHAGVIEDEVLEHIRDDAERVFQIVLDQTWDGGYRSGLRAAGDALRTMGRTAEETR